VALTGTVSLLVLEGMNYSVLHFISGIKLVEKARHSAFVEKIIRLFNRAPFAALFIAGFLPVPFYPLRLLTVLARYSWVRYLFTVLISKLPRFFLLGLFGHFIDVPDYIILVFFIMPVFLMYFSYAVQNLRKRKTGK
jgi:ribonucleoside-triphosphate reductase